jgi:hypothetical protein
MMRACGAQSARVWIDSRGAGLATCTARQSGDFLEDFRDDLAVTLAGSVASALLMTRACRSVGGNATRSV